MKIIELTQRTPAWKKYRESKIMASDSAAILGCDEYKSSYQVFLDKIGMGKEVLINSDMERGILLEDEGRKLLEEKLSAEFIPKVAESEIHSWLAASLDGYYEWNIEVDENTHMSRHEGTWICEIKCPRESGFNKAKQGFISDRHVVQVQHQLLVTDADLCFFANYFDGELAIIEVRPDADIQQRIITETKEFWEKHVLGYEAPPLGKGDYIDKTNDYEFNEWSTRWTENQMQKALIEEREKYLRAEGLALANNQNVRGFGLEISHTPRKGLIDYKHQDVVAALSALDLENYRKPTTMVSTIRIKK